MCSVDFFFKSLLQLDVFALQSYGIVQSKCFTFNVLQFIWPDMYFSFITFRCFVCIDMRKRVSLKANRKKM